MKYNRFQFLEIDNVFFFSIEHNNFQYISYENWTKILMIFSFREWGYDVYVFEKYLAS